ncbi:MAG: MoaD/ThiS family protein [Anaerolineales bacterium]|jgi:sulfur carrier protein ThiS
MKARLQLRDQIFEVRAGMTVRSALLKLDIPPGSVLATRNQELITDDELLKEDDHVRLLPVISGGSSR